VLGSPARPFAHERDPRPFIASSTVNAPLPVEILRGKGRVTLHPVVGRAPAAKAKN
jgi:hypothetical protein